MTERRVTWRTSRPAMAARWHLGATILCNPSASLLQELPLCASAASHVCCLRCTKTKGMLHAHTKATKYGTMRAAVCCLHPSLLGSQGRWILGLLGWEKKRKEGVRYLTIFRESHGLERSVPKDSRWSASSHQRPIPRRLSELCLSPTKYGDTDHPGLRRSRSRKKVIRREALYLRRNLGFDGRQTRWEFNRSQQSTLGAFWPA